MQKAQGRHSRYPLAILLLSGMFVAAVALYLNNRFYLTYGPFYDSMSYLNHLAWVMWVSEEKGVWHAIREAATGSTVFLPWMLGALLAPITEPSRMLGVVVQLPLLLLQLFTGYRYFRSVSGASDVRAILYALTLVAYPAVFHFNGGLGDFRMDLSQAYGYGAFLAALLLARKKKSIWEWVVVGVIVAIVSLFRATTPVYVAIVTCFALLLDLRERGMRASVVGYLVMGAVVVVLAGWFFIGNYDFLHYYYAVWNTDANARLPLAEAIRHIYLLTKHIGLYLLSALLLSVLAGIVDHLRYRLRSAFRLNWVALIGGLVPITYLVLSGAGLNPFVSMVAVPGLIVFMLQPIDSDAAAAPLRYTRFVPLAVALGLVASLVVSVARFEKEVSEWVPYRAAIDEMTEVIATDANSRGIRRASMAFFYLGGLDGSAVVNHLIYERGYKYREDRSIERAGLNISFRHYGFSAEAEWREMPGGTDKEKLAYVVKDAASYADYIVMANQSSTLPQHHKINTYASEMRSKLDDTRYFTKLVTGIRLSKVETVDIYKPLR